MFLEKTGREFSKKLCFVLPSVLWFRDIFVLRCISLSGKPEKIKRKLRSLKPSDCVVKYIASNSTQSNAISMLFLYEMGILDVNFILMTWVELFCLYFF